MRRHDLLEPVQLLLFDGDHSLKRPKRPPLHRGIALARLDGGGEEEEEEEEKREEREAERRHLRCALFVVPPPPALA